MEIGEFIAARLGEEEADARAAPAGQWEWSDRGHSARLWAQEGDDEPRLVLEVDQNGIGYSPSDKPGEWIASTGAARHIARQDPAATLARVEALRALVGEHDPIKVWAYFNEATKRHEEGGSVCVLCGNRDTEYGWEGEWPCKQLRHIAAIWSWHPDYDESWRL